jgi:hypothetical protein
MKQGKFDADGVQQPYLFKKGPVSRRPEIEREKTP